MDVGAELGLDPDRLAGSAAIASSSFSWSCQGEAEVDVDSGDRRGLEAGSPHDMRRSPPLCFPWLVQGGAEVEVGLGIGPLRPPH